MTKINVNFEYFRIHFFYRIYKVLAVAIQLVKCWKTYKNN